MTRRVLYHGRKIQVARDVSSLPDGRAVERDVVIHPGAVAILPLVDRDHVCLIRNVRPAVGETLLEIPAGTLEPGEPVERAAERELAEETGYRAGRWTKLGEFFPSPGVLSERTHLFLAQDLRPGPAHPEPDEEIRTEVTPWDRAMELALGGEIRDAKTLIALLWFDRIGRQSNSAAATR